MEVTLNKEVYTVVSGVWARLASQLTPSMATVQQQGTRQDPLKPADRLGTLAVLSPSRNVRQTHRLPVTPIPRVTPIATVRRLVYRTVTGRVELQLSFDVDSRSAVSVEP